MSNVASERVVNGVKTRNLHGKDYVEVSERVRIAHSKEHEFEQVETVHFSIGERWFVRCVIKVDGKLYIGTAEIKFTAPKNTPDGTNPFECAETSALGRALAFAGLGTVESIASFDEVYRAMAQEEPMPTYRDIYTKGQKKGLWTAGSGFYAFASALLGEPISQLNVQQLTAEQLVQLDKAVDEEPARPAGEQPAA